MLVPVRFLARGVEFISSVAAYTASLRCQSIDAQYWVLRGVIAGLPELGAVFGCFLVDVFWRHGSRQTACTSRLIPTKGEGAAIGALLASSVHSQSSSRPVVSL